MPLDEVMLRSLSDLQVDLLSWFETYDSILGGVFATVQFDCTYQSHHLRKSTCKSNSLRGVLL